MVSCLQRYTNSAVCQIFFCHVAKTAYLRNLFSDPALPMTEENYNGTADDIRDLVEGKDRRRPSAASSHLDGKGDARRTAHICGAPRLRLQIHHPPHNSRQPQRPRFPKKETTDLIHAKRHHPTWRHGCSRNHQD